MPKKSTGQMLILVVLILIVALTVGLSLAARTVINLRLSKQNEESQRAFQAAEAGVEQILQSASSPDNFSSGSSDNLANNSSYTTSVSYTSGSSFMLNGGELVDQDVGIDVWLSNYPDFANPTTGNITFYWSTENQTTCSATSGNPQSVKSAIEIILLSGSKTLPTMKKYIYESCTSPKRITQAQNASSGGTPFGNIAFQSSATIPVYTNGIILRVVPIYNSTKIAVVAQNGSGTPISLPKQGTVVASTGTSGSTTRKVQYFASYPQIPLEIFPYTLISQ